MCIHAFSQSHVRNALEKHIHTGCTFVLLKSHFDMGRTTSSLFMSYFESRNYTIFISLTLRILYKYINNKVKKEY